MAKALIVSAGNNANEYLARHIGELGYTRPTIVASGGEARRRMDSNDYEVIIINTHFFCWGNNYLHRILLQVFIKKRVPYTRTRF